MVNVPSAAFCVSITAGWAWAKKHELEEQMQAEREEAKEEAVG